MLFDTQRLSRTGYVSLAGAETRTIATEVGSSCSGRHRNGGGGREDGMGHIRARRGKDQQRRLLDFGHILFFAADTFSNLCQ